jgi:lipid A ethanolaminephosphotransferase
MRDKIPMALKLFRSTGYGPLLDAQSAAAWQKLPERARSCNPIFVLIIVSAWLATVCNYALWRELSRIGRLNNPMDFVFAIGLAVIVFAAICTVFALLAWRKTIKPAAIFLLIAAALGAHFMTSYGVVIDRTMMINTLQTNPNETRDLLNLKFFGTLLVLGILPSLWVLRARVRSVTWLKQASYNAAFFIAACALFALTIAIFYQSFASLMRNHTHVRYLLNPLNSVYALADIAATPLKKGPLKMQPLGQDAKLGASYASASNKAPLVLLVVGETARAGNFGINGYAQPTTPQLGALMATDKMVSLRNAWSCGTSTAASLPCMFSHLGREAYDSRPANYDNLLDVLQRAGLAVLWLDNQAGCKGLCDRIANASTTDLKDSTHCSTGECFDEIMLKDLDARIAALPAAQRTKGVVVVMHQMGSHGPAYFKRVPESFKQFTPLCASNALQDCQRAEVVNAYDNTILYTDHFLASAVKWLKTQSKQTQAAMVYIADHGESLGENNLYLHGLPYAIAPDVQKRVPWITWLSDDFARRSRLDINCLKAATDTRVSHDNLFHSVLGLMDVHTSVYRRDADIYAPCVK